MEISFWLASVLLASETFIETLEAEETVRRPLRTCTLTTVALDLRTGARLAEANDALRPRESMLAIFVGRCCGEKERVGLWLAGVCV